MFDVTQQTSDVVNIIDDYVWTTEKSDFTADSLP